MSASEFYEIVKYWLPLITVFLLCTKAYFSGKKNIAEWANALLNNHVAHIQKAVEATANAQHEGNVRLSKLSEDLQEHHESELKAWQSVSTTLELLKDRTKR